MEGGSPETSLGGSPLETGNLLAEIGGCEKLSGVLWQEFEC